MLPEIPQNLYYLLGAVLFTIGAIGVITRRNAIIDLHVHRTHAERGQLTFIASGNFLNSLDGIIFVFFIMAVAAAEAAVGLAIFVLIFRLKGTINIDDIHLLKG